MMFGLVGDVGDKSLNKLGRPFSTYNPASGCFSPWEHWFIVRGSRRCGKSGEATRRLWQEIRLPSGVWQYVNPSFSMESVAAIFSLVAIRHSVLLKTPFVRMSQSFAA